LDEHEGPVDVAVNRAEASTRQIAWDADAIARPGPSADPGESGKVEADTQRTQTVDSLDKVVPIGMWNKEGNLVPLPEKVTAGSKKQTNGGANTDEQIRKGVRILSRRG
jgi:hypothetical protein